MTEQAWPIDSVDRNDDGTYSVKLRGVGSRFPRTAQELAAVGITPPPDSIDFDTLPIGSVLRTRSGYFYVKAGDGYWYDSEEKMSSAELPDFLAPYTVVHVPAPPSKLDALHTIGYDDEHIDRIARDGAYWEDATNLVRSAREAQAQR